MGVYTAAVLVDSPNCYWRLGETSGTAAAEEQGVAPGTFGGSITLAQTGALAGDANTAFKFNGAFGPVSVAHVSALDVGDTLSIEFWLKRSGNPSSNEGFFAKGAGCSLVRAETDGKIYWHHSGTGLLALTSIVVCDGAWHHVVLTKSGSTRKIYVDGVDRTVPSSNSTLTNNSNALTIGADGGAGLNGYLDEVALYPTALSATRVLAHFTAATVLGGSAFLLPDGGLGIESTLLRPGAEPLNLTPHISLEKFTTNANGGFGSAQFTLPGGPDKWAGQIPYLATLRLTHGPRLLYEGRVEDPGLKIAAGEMSTTVQCFGRHRLFADNSVRRIWSKREIPWRPITAAEGTVSAFAATLSLGKAAWNSVTIGTFDQTDLRRRGVEIKGEGAAGSAAGAAMGVFYYGGGLALQSILFDVTTDTADDAWYIVRSSSNGTSWTERDAGQATTKTSKEVSLGGDTYVQLLAAEDGGSGGLSAFVQYEDIRLLGTTLGEDTDGGFWGGTLLRDLVGLIPGLSVGTIDTGDDFVVQQLDAAVRREAKSVLDEIAGYYTREPATWEDGRFDWRQPNLDEVHWTATIADLTSLELTGSIDGIGRTFYLLFANAALGIDDEAVAVSTDQRNPFVKTGQVKDVISSPGFPMTQNSAGQLAGKLANDTGRWPLVRGQLTLPLLRPVRHASIGQAPAYCIRAGENILVADLPKTDWLAAGRDGETLFHVVSADVDLKANMVSLELEGQSKRADVLLARLSAVTRTLSG